MSNWPRVAEDSPKRCKSGNAKGQCWLSCVSGSEYCPIHGGLSAIRSRNQEAKVRMLKFVAMKDVLDGVEENEIGSLRSEITVLKGMLTVIWNRCKTEDEIALRAGPIGELCAKIEKIVQSAHKLDKERGEMMSSNQLDVFAAEILDIITRHVKDIAILELIADEIEQLETRRPDRLQ
jgi:hypothetical protein